LAHRISPTGADWVSIAETVTSIMYRPGGRIIVMGGFIMSACSVCGASPCINPSFCAACRDADPPPILETYARLRADFIKAYGGDRLPWPFVFPTRVTEASSS
jgi:hypothetical protein